MNKNSKSKYLPIRLDMDSFLELEYQAKLKKINVSQMARLKLKKKANDTFLGHYRELLGGLTLEEFVQKDEWTEEEAAFFDDFVTVLQDGLRVIRRGKQAQSTLDFSTRESMR